jgi:hypothetical protein
VKSDCSSVHIVQGMVEEWLNTMGETLVRPRAYRDPGLTMPVTFARNCWIEKRGNDEWVLRFWMYLEIHERVGTIKIRLPSCADGALTKTPRVAAAHETCTMQGAMTGGGVRASRCHEP